MTETSEFIDPSVPPSGAGCVECDESGWWWVHLRRCAKCGHIGCCDDSLHTHATKHYEATGHAIIRSFEPGEEWFWDYATDDYASGPALAPPEAHRRSVSLHVGSGRFASRRLELSEMLEQRVARNRQNIGTSRDDA